MIRLVTAETILEMTRDAAYDAPKDPLPDTTAFEKASPADKVSLINAFQKAQSRKNSAEPVSAVRLKAAEDAIADMPAGFKLAPLVYTRVSKEQNKKVYREFTRVVKPRFLKFLAHHHADDLRAMGICEAGIKRMSRGIDPADKNGRLYDVSVDHIIERSGGGKLSYEKAVDSQLHAGIEHGDKPKTFKVNHFSNLILMPNDVHIKCKNVINDIQNLPETTAENESLWAVMLVPVRSTKSGLYAYRPKSSQIINFGAKNKKMTIGNRLSHCQHLLDQLEDALKDFFAHAHMKKTRLLMEQIAKDKGVRLEDALIEAHKNPKHELTGIRDVFNTSFALASRQARYDFKRLLGISNEINIHLAGTIAALEKMRVAENTNMRNFDRLLQRLERFCEGNRLSESLKKLSRLPAPKDGTAAAIILRNRRSYLALMAQRPKKPPYPHSIRR